MSCAPPERRQPVGRSVVGFESSRAESGSNWSPETRAEGGIESQLEPLRAFVHCRFPAALAHWVEPEDVLQEVLLAALLARVPERIEGGEALRRWLMGIARHKLHEALRSGWRRSMASLDSTEQVLPERVLSYDDAPLIAVERCEELGRLARALRNLPSAQREVLSLRCSEGLSWSAVAARMALPSADAARKLLVRARARLAAVLGAGERW